MHRLEQHSLPSLVMLAAYSHLMPHVSRRTCVDESTARCCRGVQRLIVWSALWSLPCGLQAYTWWSGAAPSLLSQQLVQCFACNHKQVQQEVSGLRQQVAQQQQHIKQLTAQHNQLASKARAQWQELEHRGVTISQLQAEVAGIHQALQHEPTKQQLLNQQSIIKQLEDELADSKQQVAAAQELRYNLGQQLLQREQQLAEQSRTIADLQQQLAAQAADQRLEEWEQQKAEQDATIADLQQQLAQQQQVLQQEQRQRALLHQQYMQLRQAHQQAAQQHAMWAQDQQVLAEQAAGLAAQQRLLAERIAQQRPVQTIAAAPGAVLSPQNGQQQQRAVPQQQGAGRATPLQVQQQPACGVSGVMLSPVPVPLAQQQSYHHEDSKPHVGPY